MREYKFSNYSLNAVAEKIVNMKKEEVLYTDIQNLQNKNS